MYDQIKKLADDAVSLQNKDRMDVVLREISRICEDSNPVHVQYGHAMGFDPAAENIQGATPTVIGKSNRHKGAKK